MTASLRGLLRGLQSFQPERLQIDEDPPTKMNCRKIAPVTHAEHRGGRQASQVRKFLSCDDRNGNERKNVQVCIYGRIIAQCF